MGRTAHTDRRQAGLPSGSGPPWPLIGPQPARCCVAAISSCFPVGRRGREAKSAPVFELYLCEQYLELKGTFSQEEAKTEGRSGTLGSQKPQLLAPSHGSFSCARAAPSSQPPASLSSAPCGGPPASLGPALVAQSISRLWECDRAQAGSAAQQPTDRAPSGQPSLAVPQRPVPAAQHPWPGRWCLSVS